MSGAIGRPRRTGSAPPDRRSRSPSAFPPRSPSPRRQRRTRPRSRRCAGRQIRSRTCSPGGTPACRRAQRLGERSPAMPDPVVPSQNASMSSGGCRPTRGPARRVEQEVVDRPVPVLTERVQLMPTIATLSLMPRLAILISSASPRDRACLPEVVVDAARGRHPAEGHLDPVPHRDLVRGRRRRAGSVAGRRRRSRARP